MPKFKFQARFLGSFVCAMFIVSAASAGMDDVVERLTIVRGPHGEQLAQQGLEVPSRDARIRRGETVTNRERPELDPASRSSMPSVRVRPSAMSNTSKVGWATPATRKYPTPSG